MNNQFKPVYNGNIDFNNMSAEELREWHTDVLTEAQRENYINQNLEIVRHYRTEAIARAPAFELERNAINAAIASHGLHYDDDDPNIYGLAELEAPPARRPRLDLTRMQQEERPTYSRAAMSTVTTEAGAESPSTSSLSAPDMRVAVDIVPRCTAMPREGRVPTGCGQYKTLAHLFTGRQEPLPESANHITTNNDNGDNNNDNNTDDKNNDSTDEKENEPNKDNNNGLDNSVIDDIAISNTIDVMGLRRTQ